MVYYYGFPESLDNNSSTVENDDEKLEFAVDVDTDFAGCAKTRRNTLGGALAMGPYLLKHWPVTQTTIALSSGEPALTGIIKSTTYGLGFRSIAEDLGVPAPIHVKKQMPQLQ